MSVDTTPPEPVELHVDARGEGPPLLVLHGLYGAGSNWRRHVGWMSERWRVYTPDLRNHGRSPHARPMTYAAMAGDIAALLDREGFERATVLGHSMGGKTAMTLALRHPERVEALVVADIAPVDYGDHGHREVIDAMRSLDLEALRSRQDADAGLAAAVPESAVRQFLLTNLERRGGGWRWRIPLDILAESLPGIEGFPALDGQWRGAAFFIYGERSDYVDGRGREAALSLFPEARFQSLPGTGHFLHVEAPEAFADAVSRFLESQFTAL